MLKHAFQEVTQAASMTPKTYSMYMAFKLAHNGNAGFDCTTVLIYFHIDFRMVKLHHCEILSFSFRMIIGLSVSLGLFVVEYFGFLGGITMFTPSQGLICILTILWYEII